MLLRPAAPRGRVRYARGIEHHTDDADPIVALGGAGSSLFCGRQLERIHREGNALIRDNARAILHGEPAPPLMLHTSHGLVPQAGPFVDALRAHLPWRQDDWCVSLQLEGASAVHSACELLLDHPAALVAVADKSYHGPAASSYGATQPRGRRGIKTQQVEYPAPVRRPGERHDEFIARMEHALGDFVDKHSGIVRVVLIEPQFGSSLLGLPWPRELLCFFARRARRAGMRVVCDEVLCAGRHAERAVFLSRAWDVPADAVVFGKAIGGGIHPLAGAAMRGVQLRGAPPTHTYSGASALALSAATATLRALPEWYDETAARSKQCRLALRRLGERGIVARGQGLLWGLVCSNVQIEAELRAACKQMNVSLYSVPGGALLTPPLDVPQAQLAEALSRLVSAVQNIKSR